MLTPQEFREKQARNLTAAIPDVQAGINRVTESPTAKAAKASAKMLQNLTASVQDGTWANRLNSVSLEEWKRKARDIGAGRIAQGIAGAADKVEKFAGQFLPFLENVAKQVDAMPSMNLQDSIARMTKQVTEVSKFRLK